jgi:hypothetical protein
VAHSPDLDCRPPPRRPYTWATEPYSPAPKRLAFWHTILALSPSTQHCVAANVRVGGRRLSRRTRPIRRRASATSSRRRIVRMGGSVA